MTSARSAKRATKTPIDLNPPTSGATSTPPATATGSVTSSAAARPQLPVAACKIKKLSRTTTAAIGRHPKLAGLPLSGISQHLGVVLVREGHPAQT